MVQRSFFTIQRWSSFNCPSWNISMRQALKAWRENLFYFNHHSLFLPNHPPAIHNYHLITTMITQTKDSMSDLIQSLMINHLSRLSLLLITRHQRHQHLASSPASSLPEPKQLGVHCSCTTIITDTSSRFDKSGGGNLKICSPGQWKHHYPISPQVGWHSIQYQSKKTHHNYKVDCTKYTTEIRQFVNYKSQTSTQAKYRVLVHCTTHMYIVVVYTFVHVHETLQSIVATNLHKCLLHDIISMSQSVYILLYMFQFTRACITRDCTVATCIYYNTCMYIHVSYERRA